MMAEDDPKVPKEDEEEPASQAEGADASLAAVNAKIAKIEELEAELKAKLEARRRRVAVSDCEMGLTVPPPEKPADSDSDVEIGKVVPPKKKKAQEAPAEKEEEHTLEGLGAMLNESFAEYCEMIGSPVAARIARTNNREELDRVLAEEERKRKILADQSEAMRTVAKKRRK